MNATTLADQANSTLNALVDANQALGRLIADGVSDRLAPVDQLSVQRLTALTAALDANRAAIRVLEDTFPEGS